MWAPASGHAAVLDPTFTETTLVSSPDLGSATGLAWAPDGSNRLFVTRKDGEIRIIKEGALLPTPFATVAPLYNGSECGVIGIAFDPNFLASHYVYIFATVSASEQQIIRYTVDGDLGTAKTTVVPGLPTAGANHDGGGLGIGPDGKIYWAIGDQGAGIGVNADLSVLAAKVGRANPDGSPVGDNPFVDGAGPNADHIWARGFRNPFTLTFQPATGLLWVDDTGGSYEQIFVVHKGDHAGWNTYENNQPQGFIAPVITYLTNGVYARGILPAATPGAARAGAKITFVTDAIHGFRLGQKITVDGVVDITFNSTFYVDTIPSETSFTVDQAGPDAVSGGGTATSQALGGAVTGGAFYDATDFPTYYRGNFFFGDYNSGNIVRATIDPTSNNVTSVDVWGTGVSGAVDIAVGPDGALYYVGVSSSAIFRAAYNATVQGLVVSPTNVWIAEGQPANVMVRLATMPAQDITVSTARAAGDAEIAVISGATLTFTSTNWNLPQSIIVAAGRDLDTADDAATIAVTAAGLAPQMVTVHARDDNSLSLVVSAATLSIDEGTTGTFSVALSQQPSLDVNVTVARATGDADIAVSAGGTLTFTGSNWATPQTVTVSAAEDADGADDAAVVSVTSPGLAGKTLAVNTRDNDAMAPKITSSPMTKAVVGAPYTYDVKATGLPQPLFSLDSSLPGLSINPSSGGITWVPRAAGSFMVTVRAANGVVPDATQTFGVDVSPDMAPTCTLIRPLAGDVVAGAMADFSGDGMDDVGTVKAEFYVDGVLGYSDVGPSGHYQYGGAPQSWNTTDLARGSHTVKMVVFDTVGQTCTEEATVTVANVPDAGPEAGADAAVPGPDGAVAGPDAAVLGSDAGGPDRGGTKIADSGCGCRTGGDRDEQWGATALALVFAFVVRARRKQR